MFLDGLHLGHAYLLRHSGRRGLSARGRAHGDHIDHHPDEILVGNAPPLLIDPAERLERLAAAGIAVTVVQHFDEELRRTPYATFVERIRTKVELRGFLMTPDAAFGFERRGTPEALAEMGERVGFDVVVVPPFDLDGRQVRSSEIRVADRLGRSSRRGGVARTPGHAERGRSDGRLSFDLPMAVPPDGRYEVTVDAASAVAEVEEGSIRLPSVTRVWSSRRRLPLNGSAVR